MNTSTQQDQSGMDSGSDVVVHAGEVPLSGPQRQAMEWLMQGGSIVEAAQYAGVTWQTVSRWIHEDPDFAALFEHWQAQVKSVNKARLVSLTEAAMDTVADAIRNHRDVKTALTILKGAGVLGKST